MKYECNSRFKDHRYRIGDVISKAEYDQLPDNEKRKFIEHPQSFGEELEENREEDARLDNL